MKDSMSRNRESKTFRIMHIKKTSASILSPQIYTILSPSKISREIK